MPTTPDSTEKPNQLATPNAAEIDINPTGSKAREAFAAAKEKVGEQASDFKEQATGKARDYAAIGKEKAVEGLDSVTRLMDDAASTIDDKVGAQYGDYARKAASAVSNVATSLRSKDVDELLEDARTVVRKSPALAIGAAVAVGFVLARLVRAGKDGGQDKSA
ncbi:hypothetical protein [Sphingomonas fennica]|uniref:DUF883 domain-containing protein n=1 Tax=Edaphosphingomonas fennica TaxID=114404 RepID=A0A2T4I5E6_9SPHN|nr:hypothetical protein [Sphingomonas fennica]PTD25214.1 hypothetical protein CV103_06270 [Sphingomonas fennica]